MKKLREGLTEPSEVPAKDLSHYMAATYRGYMVSLKQRMDFIQHFEKIELGYKELNREFLALQLRMVFELLAFAVITLSQRESSIGKRNRSKNDALKVLKICKNHSWISSVDPKFKMQEYSGSCTVPLIKTKFTDGSYFAQVHGRIGDLLHEQQRPRPTDDHRYSIKDLLQITNDLRVTLLKHFIVDENGTGWYVDLQDSSQPNNVLMLVINNYEHIPNEKMPNKAK